MGDTSPNHITVILECFGLFKCKVLEAFGLHTTSFDTVKILSTHVHKAKQPEKLATKVPATAKGADKTEMHCGTCKLATCTICLEL